MSIGVWVAIIAICFVVGNVMGLKPKISEMRIGEMRLFARKIDLNPKLVPIPNWLAVTVGKSGMIAQYTLINDEWRLPANQVAWTDGVWQGDFTVISPPLFCVPYLRGLSMKANSITLYWHDESYVKGFAVQDEGMMTKMEQDLIALKEFLTNVGNQV